MIRLEDLTEHELATLMTDLARTIERRGLQRGLHPKPYFTLLLWNDPKVAQYVSNCERASMIAALRETADRLERNQDVRRRSFPEP
jgi:hypothetical protein